MSLAAALDINDGGFTWYVLSLLAGGVIQLLVTVFGFGLSKGGRIVSALFAAVFLGYGLYLVFFFTSGGYRYFPYALAVPVLFMVNIYRLWSERRKQAAPPV
jgi:hypothetical protein